MLTEKQSFVLKQSPDMAVRDVVAAARKTGIKISPNYVWMVRNKHASKAPPASARQKPIAPTQAERPTAKRAPYSQAEQQFMHLALHMGLLQANDLLAQTRDICRGSYA